jgi:hypothetical protein
MRLATAGLFAAWAAHDLEELATMSGNSGLLISRLPGWLPIPPSAPGDGDQGLELAAAFDQAP